MRVHFFEQYSDEYWAFRLGKLSASQSKKLVTSTGKLGTWQDYIYKTCAELETKYYEETTNTRAMQRGHELEPIARESFSLIHNLEVVEVGIVEADHTPLICSPDGMGENFGLEIKCVNAGAHLRYRTEGVLPTEHKCQVFTSLYICDEVDYWYFFSYHPDMRSFTFKQTRDCEDYQNYIAALQKYTPKFIDAMDKIKKGI